MNIPTIQRDAHLAAEAGRPITACPYTDELAVHHWRKAYADRMAEFTGESVVANLFARAWATA
ncbi:hypothetical protein LT85_1004 [Collimonas arenae]|uniref:Uncharacterized protein n=1 Tax=Collimonas arenae TaxID=279058 RepID=A0A0A1FBE8_9BURK|nr:hypothetical protein [Collimonas arenae]AIY40162.1 hypothetical protein LT85_1004 [Collimonas arenae]